MIAIERISLARRLLAASSSIVVAFLVGGRAQADAQASPPAAAPPTAGQPPATTSLPEVVVTAERRATNVQSTALSITAVTGRALLDKGQTNVESLSSEVPNLTFSRSGPDAAIFIRGLGYESVAPGNDTRVALYEDGIYESRDQAAFLAFYDLDRVEVLSGPQGTLYGRNAVGGAINIISRDPTSELGGYVSADVGNYGLFGAEGAIGGPVTDKLSVRFAFQTADRDGYGINVTSGGPARDEHTRSARAKIKYEASDHLTIRAVAYYSREDDHNGGYTFISDYPGVGPDLAQRYGFVYPSNPQDTAGPGPHDILETYGASIQADLKLTPSTTLTSLTGIGTLTTSFQNSVDGSTFTDQIINLAAHQLSEEFRLSQKFGEFADLLVGAYVFREHEVVGNHVGFAGVSVGIPTTDLFEGYRTEGDQVTTAYAAFSQATFHLTKRIDLTLGGRYSTETKSLDEGAEFDFTRPFLASNPFMPFGTLDHSATESQFNPKVTLDYRFSPSIFAYATYAQGFKSGGFNIGSLQPAFQPETLNDYEIGLKSTLFDRRLRANVSAFYYDYSNLQVSLVEGTSIITKNAASATIKGVEAAITALPTSDLTLTLNASYLDSAYQKFIDADPARPWLGPLNLAGNELDNAPRAKVNFQAEYTIRLPRGQLIPRFDVTWTDRTYFSPFNLDAVSQPAWFVLDADVRYVIPGSGWSLDAYGKNLTDKTYVVGATASTALVGAPVVGQYGAPRTFGFRVTKEF